MSSVCKEGRTVASEPPQSVGPELHTDFVTHELLWSVLDAQRANATLSGNSLRQAAQHLLGLPPKGRTLLMAFDAAGERIVGAAMALADRDLKVYDYTTAFPARATCLLVGGYVAGPVGIAEAAASASRAGARLVEVALLGGWADPISGVAGIRQLGPRRANVA